ncbi:expressed unknown protein [Seminavis robusta]|uniref:Uncharacterized protein n=1 Tax=Seminavis robusta TaxID=568900 RepID=A0A9N8DJI2_9STRA|nr:expressed unknown protein [Seminavis robusta]|eukprot:Sro156_g070830.1 n/a (231) ;mRNA; f:53095-53787
MVVVGNYSVRIVNAETKEPFKEHKGPDGKIYAEVEPDVEYFIEVDVIGGGKNSMACFEFHVDGEKLPYRTISNETHGKSYKGVWSCVNGVDKMQAFAFKRPVLTDSKGSSGPPGALIGDVQVDVSEAIYAGTCTRPDYKSDSLQAASVSSSLTNVQTKKVLRSGTGSVAETSARSIKVTSVYSPGVLLESITIHYCTALGLIHAGVFGKWKTFGQRRGLSILGSRHPTAT